MEDRVRIRMYQVGFGDCLLLTFPGPLHVVVDCGTIGRIQDLGPVVEDIRCETGGEIRVVIASHRHRDHVNGFGHFARIWNHMRVAEVWLPWTENPGDPKATELKARQNLICRRLLTRIRKGDAGKLALNSLTDEAAMDVLLNGFAGQPLRRFLGSPATSDFAVSLPGVHVAIGGPARSRDRLTALDVECSMSELATEAIEPHGGFHGGGHVASDGSEHDGPRPGPFASRWQIDRRNGASLFRSELKGRAVLKPGSDDSLEQIGFWLDRTINDTSLLLLFRCGGARLLLPGDTQGLGWMTLLDQPELLAELDQTTLYKAAHHGSHGGTPEPLLRTFARRTGVKLVSLVSTDSEAIAGVPHPRVVSGLKQLGLTHHSDRPRRKSTHPWVDVHLPV